MSDDVSWEDIQKGNPVPPINTQDGNDSGIGYERSSVDISCMNFQRSQKINRESQKEK